MRGGCLAGLNGASLVNETLLSLKMCPVVGFTDVTSVKIVADSRPGLKTKTKENADRRMR